MWLDLVTWTVAWVDACRLAQTCPCSETTEIAWSQVEQRMCVVFCCVVEPAFADTFRAAAALFAARLPSGAVESPPCCASEVAPEAAAAFFLDSSFLVAERRPYSEVDPFGSPLCPVGPISWP